MTEKKMVATKLRRRGFWRQVVENRTLLLMILPALLFFTLFSYVPMPGIILAFKRYTYEGGIFGSPWAGFNNFRFFFVSGDALRVTTNTILFNLTFLVVNTVLQCGVAILLSEIHNKLFKKVTQTLMFLPYFISWVVVGAFVYNILNYEFGALNTMLRSLGQEPVDVYGNPGVWKYILIICRAWKDLGYGIVLYLAAIMSIDQEMYEAADIDGANIFQKIRAITIPCLVPTIIILTLLAVSYICRGDFQMFYNVVGNNGMLFNATDVIDTYVFRSLIRVQEFGMSAAVGAYQSVLNLVIILTINGIIRKVHSEYALF